MLSINKYILLTSLLLISLASFAQKESPDKKKEKVDTIQISFRPKGIRFGTDLLGATKTAINSGKTALEFSADIELYRYLINFEYGQYENFRVGSDASIYQNKGTYFRTGIDINLFKKDTDVNILFFGLRYGKATFDDQLQYLQTNTLFGDSNFDRINTSINARWIEMTSGIKLHIAHNFWLGFTNRFKFSLKVDDSDALTPYEIPGYGTTVKGSTWGFNYLLMYRIPFGKKR